MGFSDGCICSLCDWVVDISGDQACYVDDHLPITIPERLASGSLFERASNAGLSWEYESIGKDRSLERAQIYSHFLGWAVSIVLLLCVLVIDRAPKNHLSLRSILGDDGLIRARDW